MPGRSSGVPKNSMPAASRHLRSALTALALDWGTPSEASIRLIVRTETSLFSLSSCTDNRRAKRPRRIWLPVIIDTKLYGPIVPLMAPSNKVLSLDWRTAFHRLEGAYSPATMRSYRADVEAFETWCATAGTEAFPTSTAALCAFLEAQGKEKAPSTVQRRLYAIRKVHRLLGLEDPTRDEEVNLALRRVRRAKPKPPPPSERLTSDYSHAFLLPQPDSPLAFGTAAISASLRNSGPPIELVALCSRSVLAEDGTMRCPRFRRAQDDPWAMLMVRIRVHLSPNRIARTTEEVWTGAPGHRAAVLPDLPRQIRSIALLSTDYGVASREEKRPPGPAFEGATTCRLFGHPCAGLRRAANLFRRRDSVYATATHAGP